MTGFLLTAWQQAGTRSRPFRCGMVTAWTFGPPRGPHVPLEGLAVSGRGGGGRLSRLALIPLLLAGLEAEERRRG